MNRVVASLTLGAMLIGAGGISPVSAQQAGSMADDAWRFEATPYLFAAGLKGSTGLNGINADVDVGFSDYYKQIDSAFVVFLEARKGPWMFTLDTLYMKLSGEESKTWTSPGGGSSATADLKLTMSQYMYQPMVGHRVVDERAKVDLLGGVRFTRLDVDASLGITAPLLPDLSRTATNHESWYDGVIGARALLPLAERWTAVGYLDYGIVGGSDKTYQAYGGINWHFSRNLTAKLGYRYLKQDYSNDGFKWDMAMSGVNIGLGIGF